MRTLAVVLLAFMAIVGLGIAQSSAAQVADVCPQFISEAIDTVGNNCAGLGRNSACYGFNRVEATFVEVPSPDYFTQPSDIADLFTLTSVTTMPLRTELNEWGITLLSVQASLPDALPGQNVIFMLAGDVEVENAVDQTVSTDPNSTLNPVQAFYFRTGIAQTDCREAPDTLIVQGPKGVQVDLNANGADFRIGSTIAMRTLEPDPEQVAMIREQYGVEEEIFLIMELFVFDGQAILNPGTPNEQIIPEGYRGFRCLAPPQNLGLDGEENDTPVFEGCPWLDIRPATEQEIREFAGYEGTVLNYPIELPGGDEIASVPTPDDDATPVPPPTATAIPTTSTTAPTNTPVTPAPTPTNTTPANTPPTMELFLPDNPVERTSFELNGLYSDPDSDVLTLTVNWGDGSAPEVYELMGDGGGLGATGGISRFAVEGEFNIPHSYPYNGMFPLSVTLQDEVGNMIADGFDAPIDPMFPISLNIVSGDGQTADAGEMFANPLVVEMRDSDGAPVIGYTVIVSTTNAVFDCEICTTTDENGEVSLPVTAGDAAGDAFVEVTAAVDDSVTTTFDLEVVIPLSNPPTVNILNTENEWQNGDVFTLTFEIADIDSELLNVEIFWDDSDTPEGLIDFAPGSYDINHEFTAAGLLNIRVDVTDGTNWASDIIQVFNHPIYPLTVSHTPISGWTGEVLTGDKYLGQLRVFVQDASTDPVYGAYLYHLQGGSLERGDMPGTYPPFTLGGPGTGYADLDVTADCYARDSFQIASPDPDGSIFDEGLGMNMSYTSVSVEQLQAYNFTAMYGDGQETFAFSDFASPVGIELRSAFESPIEGADITFEIYSDAGAEFEGGGTIYNAVTDANGTAFSGTITGGAPETIFIEARYDYGGCQTSTLFMLLVENIPSVISPIMPEATEEAVNPEATPEVEPEVTPEIEPTPEFEPTLIPEVTDEPGNRP